MPEVPKGQPTLDEITNKVFEELRVGKCANKRDGDEGSCKVRKYTYLIILTTYKLFIHYIYFSPTIRSLKSLKVHRFYLEKFSLETQLST